jgi:hypothetical protein
MTIEKDEVITLMNAFHDVTIDPEGDGRRAGRVLSASGRRAHLRAAR